MPNNKRVIEITTEYIKLDQLLKLSGVCATGGEAREVVLSGACVVDGETELRRGRKLYSGAVVVVNGEELTVSGEGDGACA